MRSTIAGILVLGILATSCAADPSDAAGDLTDSASPASTSPATTSPTTTSPVTASPVEGASTEEVPLGPSTDPTVAGSDQGDVTEPANEEPIVTNIPTEDSPEGATPITPAEPVPTGPAAAAVADLAARLGIDPSGVEVVSVESVIWPDGSLGCPQPGMAYTQVQVDGALITLNAGGRTYEYHVGGSRDPFLCEKRITVDSGGSVGGAGSDGT